MLCVGYVGRIVVRMISAIDVTIFGAVDTTRRFSDDAECRAGAQLVEGNRATAVIDVIDSVHIGLLRVVGFVVAWELNYIIHIKLLASSD